MKKILLLAAALFLTASRLLAQNPVPFVNQPLVPTSAVPGGSAFNLTVNGTGFASGATVQWNGAALTTTFVNSSQLTAAVPASDIATAQTANITVVNPAPGGGLSNGVFFSVTNATKDVAFQNGTVVNGSSSLSPGLEVVTADFTGTGKLDLISVKPLGNQGWIPNYWRGNGDGTFQSPVALPTPNSFVANDVALGDFNGDGKLDLIVAGSVPVNQNFSQGAISVFLGNGNGTFQSPINSTFPALTQIEYQGITVGDVNGDGKLDIVAICQQFVSIPNGSTYQLGICTFLGNGDGTFNLTFSRFYSAPLTINSIALGDFNGDGKLDIIGTAGTPGQFHNPTYLSFLAGNGDGTFATDQIIYETTNALYGNGVVGAADLNGDGKLDLVFVHDACSNLSPSCTYDVDFFPGNGNGTFQPPFIATGLSAPVVSGLGSLARPIFGDFNGDGILDVAVGNTVFLLRNGSSTQYSIPLGGYAAGDFNGDGRLDLISSTLTSGQYVLEPVLQIAPSPDFDVAVSSTSQTVTAGGTATFTVTITAVNGFNGVVTPTQTGFFAGSKVSYNPPTVTGSGNIVITITTSISTPPGTYPLSGWLTSGSIVHSGTLTVVVN